MLLLQAIAHVSYLLSLLPTLPTAAFLIRVLIIFHEAGHGSTVNSVPLNYTYRIPRWRR